jgi:hypothetical protein
MSKNTKLTANDPHVVELFNSYHERVKTRPNLFNNGNMITVGLTPELLDYANAAAGHSGLGNGARPVGIRVTVGDATKALKDIFSSCESLAKFINSSECNAAEYIARIHERHAAKPTKNAILIDTRMIKDAFYEVGYDFSLIQKLKNAYGADTVKRDWDNLQVTEFQLRYAI